MGRAPALAESVAMGLRGALARLRGLPAAGFIRQVGETYATQIALVLLGFVNSILVVRLLGPAGRGEFAVATTLAAVGVQLMNLGLHSSNTYFVSRDRDALPVLAGNSLLVSGAAGLVALVAYLAFRHWSRIAPLEDPLLALTFVAIPLGLASLLFQNLLIGTQRIRAYNVIDLTTRVLAVVMVAATVPLHVVSPAVVFTIVQLAVVMSVVWTLLHLRPALGAGPRVSLKRLHGGLDYGLRAYLGSLAAFLVLKSDIVMVSYLRGNAETGYYSIAVGLADILLMLPGVIGTVLFPRLAAAPDLGARWQLAGRVLKVMLVGTPFALVATLVLARPLIWFAYGRQWDPSFAAVAWLMPGVGCLAINMILMNLFASCGMPRIVVVSPLVALVFNVAANLVLIPRLGFVGAAITSSVAYALMLTMSLLYIRLRLFRGLA